MHTRGDWLEIVEAIYDLGQPEERWLAAILEKLAPSLDSGLGLFAASYDASDPANIKLGSLAVHGELDPTLVLRAQAAITPDELAIMSRTVCGTTSQVLGSLFPHAALREYGAKAGVRDVFGISAHDVSGVGCTVVVPLPAITRQLPMTLALWERIAGHMIAAFRLRVRLEELEAEPRTWISVSEAVLNAAGRVEHAIGPATESTARESLRRAAVRLDRARGALRRQAPERAVLSWKALVDARWSLLDRFETDGRRYLLAVENEPKPLGPDALTERERQIVAFASIGHSNKLIAYELGIAHSTVKVLLSRAAAKFGVSSRDEVIRVFTQWRPE